MANELFYLQTSMEDIAAELNHCAAELEHAQQILRSVNLSAKAGGRVRTGTYINLSGIANAAHISGSTVESAVHEITGMIKNYESYCIHLSNAVRKASDTFAETEKRLRNTGEDQAEGINSSQAKIIEDGAEWQTDADAVSKTLTSIKEAIRGFFAAFFAFMGDPVNAFSGNYVDQMNLLNCHSPSGLDFRVYYNSMNIDSGVLGAGWTHSLESRLLLNGEQITRIHEDSFAEAYFADEDGIYRSPISYDTIEVSEEGYICRGAHNRYEIYDQSGLLICIRKKNNEEIRIIRKNDRLLGAEDRFGRKLVFRYSEEGRLAAVCDQAGREVLFAFGNGLLTEITKADGISRRYAYDHAGRLSAVIGPDGSFRMRNHYNDSNQVIRQDFCDGTSLSFRYEPGQTVYTQRDGTEITYVKDEIGRHRQTVYPDGTSETYEYNGKSQRIAFTDRCGQRHTRGFDSEGLLTYVENPLKERTEYLYENRQPAQVTNPDGSAFQAEYDNEGRMTSMTDAEGNRTQYSFTDGLLTAVRTADGAETTYVCNDMGMPESRRDAEGNITLYEYDGAGRLILEKDPLGRTETFAYDGCDRIIRETDKAGQERLFAYDFYGNLISVRDFDGLEEKWEYNAMGLLTAYTDKQDRKTRYEYDSMSNVRRMILPTGAEVRYEYDPCNRLSREMNPEGGITAYQYDACGRVTEKAFLLPEKEDQPESVFRYHYDECGRMDGVERPNAVTSHAEYGKNGKITRITYSDGSVKRFSYDRMGRLTESEDAGGDVTSYSYTPEGQLKRIIYPTGQTAEYAYNAAGRLEKASMGGSVLLKFAYDACGNVVSREDSHGYIMNYEYDKLDRTTKVSDNLGHFSTMTFDALGRMVSRTDTKGNRTDYAYTGQGMLQSAVFPDGSKVHYRYNEADQMIAMLEGDYSAEEASALISGAAFHQNPENREFALTTWKRNGSGRITERVDAYGGRDSYEYNPLGELILHTDAEGYKTFYDYDAERNVRSIRYQDGREAVFSYDGWNRPTQMEDWSGTTRLSYDGAGHPVSVTDRQGQKTEYRWNHGRMEGITYADGMELTFSFDEKGNRSRMDCGGSDGFSVRYESTDNGCTVTKELPNGIRETVRYSPAGKPERMTVCMENGGTEETVFTYDGIGNITQKEVIIHKGPEKRKTVTRYSYDVMNRLTRAEETDGGRSWEYAYDRKGNLIRVTENGVKTEYCFNLLHQAVLAQRSDGDRADFIYDGRGNRTEERWDSGKRISRSYNAQNRMETAEKHKSGKTTYLYNGLGMVVAENTETERGRKERSFQLDYNTRAHHVLAETDEQGTVNYIWDQSILCAAGKKGKLWYQCDQQGSVSGVYDEGGIRISRGSYSPFGEPLSGTDDGIRQPWGYTGMYYQDHSETWHAQNREYSPGSAAFLSRDQELYMHHMTGGGVNLYSYCLHNPILWIDPEGTDAYIFYLPEWKNEAVNDRRQLAREYGLKESEVHLIPIRSNSDFENGWNAMGTENGQTVDIDAVVINTHGDPEGLGGKNFDIGASEIRNLENKDVETLILLGCNSGHNDYRGTNPRDEFARKTNGGNVLASDGTVYSGFSLFNLTNRPYRSKNDDSFRRHRRNGDRDNAGWTLSYYDENGQLVTQNLDDKKMTVSNMIEISERIMRQRRASSGC